MHSVLPKNGIRGAHDPMKSSVTRRQPRKRSGSTEDGNPSPAKRQRLRLHRREETPGSQQQPTPESSIHSNFSGRDSLKTAASSSSVSSWLNSFNSNQEPDRREHQESDQDHQSTTSIPISLAGPPPDNPEQAPKEFEELEIESIHSLTNSSDGSDDEMADSTKSSGKTYRTRVAEPGFRKQRLEPNNIWFRNHLENVPADVLEIVERIKSVQKYPDPTDAEYQRLDSMIWGFEEKNNEEELSSLGEAWVKTLQEMDKKDGMDVTMEDDIEMEDTGVARTEGEVKTTLEENLLPIIKGIGGKIFFKHLNTHPVDRQALPPTPFEDKLSLPRPVPDTLFGHVRTFLGGSPVEEATVAQANDAMSYPFMSVEYKSPGSNRADTLWVGTNQVIMGCLACSHIAWKMGELMAEANEDAPNTTAFGIVTNGTETRLHVSWREEGERPKYVVAFVEDFLLTRREEYKKFRMYIFNIFRWAKSRHDHIRRSVNNKYAERRRAANDKKQGSGSSSYSKGRVQKRKSPRNPRKPK